MASKLTGIWAFLAVTTWLAARRQWRSAAMFAMAGAGTAVIVLGIVQMLTGGGLSQHLVTFSVAGVGGARSLLRGPNQILHNLRGWATGAVVLVPFAVLGALLASSWRHLSLIHLALGYAFLLLLVVFSDVGTGYNQLLDFIVLTVLAVGHLAGRAASSTEARTGHVIMLTLAVAVVWATSLDLVRTVGFEVRRSVAAVRSGQPVTRAAHVLAGMIRPGEEVLSGDPSVAVASGRRPVVMDPFMFARLDRTHPELVDPLIARIEDRRFDLVVLVMPLEDSTLDDWWRDYHFGLRVVDALRRAYRPDGTVGPYYLYRPAP